jgi:hypothetical protein
VTSITQLQRQADAERVGLADTLGQLRDGVTPSALSGEAIALVKDTGLSMVKSLSDQARANPVPALLIGAGIVMLLTRTTGGDVMSAAGSALRSAAATGADAARSAAGAAGHAMRDAASAASGAAAASAMAAGDAVLDAGQRATSAVGDKVTQLRERVGGGIAEARETVGDAVDQGRRGLHDRQDQARDLAHDAQEKVVTMAAQTRQSVARLIEEQPILMAALGAALGAAVGAALPLSQTEKDLLGEAGVKALGAGREALSGAANVVSQEVAGADIGARMSDIADKVIRNVTKANGTPGSGPASAPARDLG